MVRFSQQSRATGDHIPAKRLPLCPRASRDRGKLRGVRMMIRLSVAMLLALGLLGGCTQMPGLGGSGGGSGAGYTISPRQAPKVRATVAETLNTIRLSAGLSPLAEDPALIAAAEDHALQMARQNRPWTWGADGLSPPERVARAGYAGPLVGMAVAESITTETEILTAWLESAETRPALLAPEGRSLGLGWVQEGSGKIWWVLIVGG